MTEHFIIFPHLFIGKSGTNKKHQPNIILTETLKPVKRIGA